MEKALRFCNHAGCFNLAGNSGYCEEHQQEAEQKIKERNRRADKYRGSAAARGYGYRWQKYSRAYLSKPGNQFCRLHLPGCTLIAECVDHIDPPDGPKDKKFWDKDNHQPACLHCNSVKGHRKIVGTYYPLADKG